MTYLRVGGILPILEPPLPEFFVGGFFGRRFASWLAFEAGEGVFEHSGDAAVAAFGSAAIEDAEEMVAALQGSHGLPALIGAGIASESELQNGRQVEFGFHSGHKLFGNPVGAADASFRAFFADYPIANPFAHGKAKPVEPAAEGALFVEDALEFGGDDGDALFSVRFPAGLGGFAHGGGAAGPEPVCDKQAVGNLAAG